MNNAIYLNNINNYNTKIMQFLYDHVEPEQLVEDIKDKKLRTLCEEILKWNSEMNEYWVDDEKRCIKNVLWGMKLATKCRDFGKPKPKDGITIMEAMTFRI